MPLGKEKGVYPANHANKGLRGIGQLGKRTKRVGFWMSQKSWETSGRDQITWEAKGSASKIKYLCKKGKEGGPEGGWGVGNEKRQETGGGSRKRIGWVGLEPGLVEGVGAAQGEQGRGMFSVS